MRTVVYKHQQCLSYFLLLLITWCASTSVWSSDHMIDSANITVAGFASIAKTNPKLSKDNMTGHYSKETNPQLTSSKSKQAPQYYKKTHTFVAAVAKNILPNSDMKTEITSYLGTVTGDCSSSPDSGSSILDGVWKEDCAFSALSHFWDPDTNVGLFGQQSAYERAQDLWTDALAIYSVGIEARGRAYSLLGRVAHLLEDMAQPAHVHLDAHIPFLEPNDNYEVLVNDMHSDYISSEPRTGMGSNIVSFLKGYPLTPIQYYDLPSNLSGGSYDYSQSGYLNRLFLNLAETADFFESEDVKGDSDRIQFDRIGSEEINWHADGALPPDSSPEFTVEHARIHADTLIPLAERYVAGLYQLFWDKTHPVRIDDVSLAATLGCNGFDNREWVYIKGQWFDNYSTVILNDGTSSYIIPESRIELISSTNIRVCAEVRYTPNWTAVVENNPANVSNIYNFLVPVPKLPSVSIYASPSSITSGGSSTLTWTSANTTACEASGGWQGPKGTNNSELVSPTSTTTYTLTCTGAGGSDVDSTRVTVGAGSILPPIDVSASDGTYSTGILVLLLGISAWWSIRRLS